jgi:chromosome segregation ATPase
MEEIQANKDLVDTENVKLRSEVLAIEQKHRLSEAEVERLKVELSTLVEAKEEAAKAFEAEKLEIMKELEDLKWKAEEIQTSKDLVIGENDKLRSEVVTTEQKLSLSEEEVGRLKMELDALAAVKEAAAMEFDAKKTEIMKELEDLNEKVEEIKANKDLVMGENDKLRSDVLTAELKYRLFEEEIERLKMELGAQLESKEATAKAFNAEKVQIMKELEDLKREVEEIQAIKDLVVGENDKLRLEVLIMQQKHSLYEVEAKELQMELDALAEAKEEAAKAFDVEKAEITKELVDLRRKVEEIQASKELVMVENDKLRSDVLTIEQKHSLFETEMEKLKMELVALTKAKEEAAMVFDAEKTKIMKELEDLKREAERSQANLELAEEAVHNKDALVNNLRAELEELDVTMSQLQTAYDRLDAKHSRLTDEKNSIQKAMDNKRVEVAVMKSKIEVLQNDNAEKDGEIGKLNAALEKKKKRGIRAIFSSAIRCLPSFVSK